MEAVWKPYGNRMDQHASNTGPTGWHRAISSLSMRALRLRAAAVERTTTGPAVRRTQSYPTIPELTRSNRPRTFAKLSIDKSRAFGNYIRHGYIRYRSI